MEVKESIYMYICFLGGPPLGGGAFKRTSLPIREINKVHSFIYLFNENCWGCSWPQAIPLLSTPRTDTHIYHAWGLQFSPLEACSIGKPYNRTWVLGYQNPWYYVALGQHS